MLRPFISTLYAVAAFILLLPPALAANPMGYKLLSADQAAALPHSGGALGMDVGAAQRIADADLTFDVLSINSVKPGSPGEAAGFRAGDEIIAVNGFVFPSVMAFGEYIGSTPPGTQLSVDYIPNGGGPAQAERIAVTVGQASSRTLPPAARPSPTFHGLPGGAKAAIGLGAAAPFGCYKLGCFSHFAPKPAQ